jgi:hypothetical protein
MEKNLKQILDDEKISKVLMNYLTKSDILNISLSSKDINSKINEKNHLLIEVIRCSRSP